MRHAYPDGEACPQSAGSNAPPLDNCHAIATVRDMGRKREGEGRQYEGPRVTNEAHALLEFFSRELEVTPTPVDLASHLITWLWAQPDHVRRVVLASGAGKSPTRSADHAGLERQVDLRPVFVGKRSDGSLARVLAGPECASERPGPPTESVKTISAAKRDVGGPPKPRRKRA